MAKINEITSTGNAYRYCIDDSDPLNLKWMKESFWTVANDVEFEDGKTLEEKMGNIKGFSTNLDVTEPGYIPDSFFLMKLFNEFEQKLNSCFQSVSNGKSLLASTITDKGVTTNSDATFSTINDNILSLYAKAYQKGYNEGGYKLKKFGGASTYKNQHYLKDANSTEIGFSFYVIGGTSDIKEIFYIFTNNPNNMGRITAGWGKDSNGLFIRTSFEGAYTGDEGEPEELVGGYIAYK